MRKDGKFSYYLTDATGNVIGLVDEAGKRTHTYAYTPYGAPAESFTQPDPSGLSFLSSMTEFLTPLGDINTAKEFATRPRKRGLKLIARSGVGNLPPTPDREAGGRKWKIWPVRAPGFPTDGNFPYFSALLLSWCSWW